jgi:hypothetical protein
MDYFLLIAVLDVLVLMVAAAVLTIVVRAVRHGRHQKLKLEDELATLRRLAFEDVTAFGEDLTKLDSEVAGSVLDDGAATDYQRALDTYEVAKVAGEEISKAEDIRRVAEAIEDGRHAIACVRARAAGEPLPTRRMLCFFDPRHGISVADVPFTSPDGTDRLVPACALDTERVRAGADPDTRKVLIEGDRVPYWQGGPAYGPYAAAYFGLDAFSWILLGGLVFDGFGSDYRDGDHHPATDYAKGSGSGVGDAGLFGGDFGI